MSNIIWIDDHVSPLRLVCGLMYGGGNGLNVMGGFTLGSFQIGAPNVRGPKALGMCWLPVTQNV